jgi:hypothetical protein
MAMKVNIDALITREDFQVRADITQPQASTTTIQIRDLEKDSFFHNTLRKPDFQRETSEWDFKKIYSFITSFLDGDLIPAVILWQASGYVFVIDGAHRLSALMAWVQDDYGDGDASKLFFNTIPEAQREIADRTRRYVNKTIGKYTDFKFAIQYPDKSKKDVVERAKRLGTLAIQLQWVTGDAKKAEASFFKINQQAAPIDKTEFKLLQARHKPNAIAARGILHAGSGHKYWSSFPTPLQNQIESISKEIFTLLFAPELRTPIKTLDLPVAGKGYSAQTLPLIADFVDIVNDVKTDAKSLEKIEDDIDGSVTLLYLSNCLKLLNRMTGTNSASLGLHPIVYFYSSSGRYQPTSFLAVLSFIKWLEANHLLSDFIKIRATFEAFLIKYKIFHMQIVYRYGSGLKGYNKLSNLMEIVFKMLLENKSEENIVAALQTNTAYSFLQPKETEFDTIDNKDFTTEVKSAAFIRDALSNPLKCMICNGLIHFNSISVDHIQRKADGGIGTVANAQLTHPYCNTTYKN